MLPRGATSFKKGAKPSLLLKLYAFPLNKDEVRVGDKIMRLDPEIVSQLSNMVHIIAKTIFGLKYVRLSETDTTRLPSPSISFIFFIL